MQKEKLLKKEKGAHRSLHYLLEPQNGIEPSSSEWQSDILTVVLLRHFQRAFQLYQILIACQQQFLLFLSIL